LTVVVVGGKTVGNMLSRAKSRKINAYKLLDACSRLFIAWGFMFGIFIYEQQFAGCFKAH